VSSGGHLDIFMPAWRSQLNISNRDPLDLIEAHFIAAAIIELRRARRCVVSHCCRLFERAAILEVGGDPCRPKTMVAEFRFDAGRQGAPAGRASTK